jgi:predicted nuclease of restriction endonuclease-like RecB superfamily
LLTADLVHVRRRGDQLAIVPLSEEERGRAAELAAAYVGLARAHVGATRGAFVEANRSVSVGAREQRLAKGLQKLVLDRCTFEEGAAVEPAELRRELFLQAAAARRNGDFDRGALLAAVAAARATTPAEIEGALYADLPDAHLLRAFDPIAPAALVAGYEAAQVQAVLLRAVKVTAVVRAQPAVYRYLFRRLKFLRLLHRIDRLPAPASRGGELPSPKPIARGVGPSQGPTKPPASGGGELRSPKPIAGGVGPSQGPTKKVGYRIEIDGPFALFESVTKYGLQLALAFPALAACDEWSLDADVRWGRDLRPLRLSVRGRAAEGEAGTAELPDDVAALLDQLRETKGPWRAQISETILELPGVGLCIPDLELTHRTTGQVVHVEVMGFWSRDAVWKRIELVERGLPHPIVFALSKHLRVSEEALDEDKTSVLYVYSRTMNARAVLEHADRAAAKARPAPSTDASAE